VTTAKKRSKKPASAAPHRINKVPLSEGVLPLEVDVDLGLMRESISFQLRHASWAVHMHFGAQFAPSDAVPRQYSVLYLISINPGVSVKTLAAAIGVDQSTLVPTLNVCEERGWIRRERGKPDRRVVALDITAKGRQTLDGMQEKLRAHEASVTSELTEGERRQLLALLRKVRSGTLSFLQPTNID
jgi:DNA-binding MarR family transcriptional regulator